MNYSLNIQSFLELVVFLALAAAFILLGHYVLFNPEDED